MPVDKFHSFETLDGKRLDQDKVIGRIPMGKSLMVLTIYDRQPIPAFFKELFKPDVIVMRIDHSLAEFDEKAERKN